MKEFQLISEYVPAGDQPTAIQKLSEGLADGLANQTLLGVTGSGKNVFHCQRDTGTTTSCDDTGAK